MEYAVDMVTRNVGEIYINYAIEIDSLNFMIGT
jgi:hypothetical protein